MMRRRAVCVLIGIVLAASVLTSVLDRREVKTAQAQTGPDYYPYFVAVISPFYSPDPFGATFGDRLFFSSYDDVHGPELWVTDGTADGTVLLKDILPHYGIGSVPLDLTVSGDRLFFTAIDMTHGRELWVTDGTADGTVLVKDITPGGDGSSPQTFTALEGRLFFTVDDGIHGQELWVSDGTTDGTVLVKDINPDSLVSAPEHLTGFGGQLFFTVDDGIHGREPWVSDGTADGTVLLKDIAPGGGPSSPHWLGPFGDRLFFAADDGIHGRELWVTDGTADGTVLLKDIRTGSDGSWPRDLSVVGERVFLTVDNDGIHGRELWVTDGTTDGTVLVKDIAPGGSSSFPQRLTSFGDRLFFTAIDGTHGRELWVSDGTADGTVLLKDIDPGSDGSFPESLTAFEGRLFFGASDGIHESHLWVTDGTRDGTILLSPDDEIWIPAAFTAFDNRLFFDASRTEYYHTLWVTDGTTEGTVQVGVYGYMPLYGMIYGSMMTVAGDHVFFVPTAPWMSPRELYAIGPSSAPPPPPPPTATPTPLPPTPTPSTAPPIITVDHQVVTVDEGSLAVNTGSAVDRDGSVIALAVNKGNLVFDGSAWEWTYTPPDGPHIQEVAIRAIDNSGEQGEVRFALEVANVAPVVAALEPPPPIEVDVDLIWVPVFTDPSPVDQHVAVVDWNDGSACRTDTEGDCSLDEGTGGVGSVSARHAYAEAGLYAISLSVTDDDGGTGTAVAGPIVVYDPDGGFVTGGGWINSPEGAYVPDPSLTGRASFGFVSKYKKGARTPTGRTEFQFKTGDLNFHSSSYDWLVVTGSNYATYKGSGMINGELGPNGEAYRFKIWAGDGTDPEGADTFRIKIWWEDTDATEHLVYDNGMDQSIGGGSIVVHVE